MAPTQETAGRCAIVAVWEECLRWKKQFSLCVYGTGLGSGEGAYMPYKAFSTETCH